MGLRLEDIERLHLYLLAAAVALAMLTRWAAPGSLALGGAVMGANVWSMRQVFRRLSGREGRNPAPAVIFLLLKFGLMMGLLGLLFWRLPIDGLSFATGATLLPVASVLAAVRAPQASTT